MNAVFNRKKNTGRLIEMRFSCFLFAVLCAERVFGHGAVVNPPPRNAVDKDLAPWNGPVPRHPPNVESKTGWCPVPSSSNGKPSGQNGQRYGTQPPHRCL